MKIPSDSELIQAVQDGDIYSYETLIKRYQRGLFSFVMHFLHDEAASYDIVQSTMIKVYEGIDKVDPEKKFSTYIFEIAKNSAISELRHRKHSVSLKEITDISQEETFIDDLYRSGVGQNVREAVAKLEDKYRRVIILYYFDDLSYEEMGKKLKIPVNTVRTHLWRAKAALKKQLHQYENN